MSAGLGASLLAPLPADDLRQRLRYDDHWLFHLGDLPNGQDPAMADDSWRGVTLPHDWSIEGKFGPHEIMGGSGGFLPSGIGWYRKHIDAPATWAGHRVVLEFDGVYMNSDVYLNGRKLCNHPYGYTTFFVDLTSALKLGGANLLAVKVNNSDQRNSRWYTGSGIYRHVWLITTGPVHVAPWGVFARTTSATAQSAAVHVETQVANEGTAPQTVTVQTLLLSPTGAEVGRSRNDCQVPAGKIEQVDQDFTVAAPALWSPVAPQLSKVETHILQNGAEVDRDETSFGIRLLTWSGQDGYCLNGVGMKLNGGCVHDDNGVLGTAAFDRAEERKADLVKAAGFNEVRTTHECFAPAFLDECDRIGLLVLEDTFDAWDQPKAPRDYSVYFKDWWQRDLDAIVRRDRNHPSIIFWNIGNEVQNPVSDLGVQRTQQLATFIHELDRTRPVCEAMYGWINPDQMTNAQKVFAAQDIVGTNYALSNHTAEEGQYPNRLVISTENTNCADGPQIIWQTVAQDPHVVGDNTWTAMDYFGESGLGRWYFEGDPVTNPEVTLKPPLPPVGQGDDRVYPWHGSPCGSMDILGNRKPMSYWWAMVRGGAPGIYLAVQQPPKNGMAVKFFAWGWQPSWASWTWPGCENQPLNVEVYGTTPTVRLYLNDKIVGEKPTSGSTGYRSIITVPYQPGTLKAVGVKDGKEIESCSLTTAGSPASIRLTPDRTSITADGQDLSFVKVEVLDKDGHLQPTADNNLTFTVQGAGTNAGVGNACLYTTDSYQTTHCRAYYGQAQIVIRSTEAPGPVTVTAHADGLQDGTATINTVADPGQSL